MSVVSDIKHIVVADPSFNFKLLCEMGKASPFRFHYSPLPPDKKMLQGAFALFIRTRLPVDEKLLNQAPDLKIIVSGTSGKNHINERVCEKRGVHLVFTGKALSDYVSEFTILLMLQLGWNSASAIEAVQKVEWKDHLQKGTGLYKRTLGIIGFGSIGRSLAKKAKAFEMNVIAYNPDVLNSIFDTFQVQRTSLEELLKSSDFVSLHLPYDKNTKNFFGRAQFALMKPSAFLINTSRGEIVCEEALIKAIETKKIKGAALDVFQKEPLPLNSPLRKLKSLILTPHFATHNQQALDLMTQESFLKLQSFVKSHEAAF